MAKLSVVGTLNCVSKDSNNKFTLAEASQIRDANLNKMQDELNALFNQGKGLDSNGNEVQVGKTYSAGTGISIDGNGVISVDGSLGETYTAGEGINIDANDQNKISIKEATNSARGGMKIASGQSNTGTPFPVQLNNGFGIVKIPEANTTQSGLAPQSLMEKIPNEASALNQLADKTFVNSSIATNTANYISNSGQPFTSLAQLQAYSGTLTNNDYAFVVGMDADGNTTYTRYKYNANTTPAAWAAEYVLNNSSFTATQWAAIQSGITSGLVAKLNALPDYTGLSALLGDKLNKAVMTTAAEAGTTASSPHAKGEYFFMVGTLYRATAAIAVNDPIVTDSAAQGYNAAATTIAGEIGNIATALEAILS